MDEAWFEAMGAEACDWTWDAGEQDDRPQRDFSPAEVRAELALMARFGHATAGAASVIGDEHARAFSLGYWREHREREDNRSEALFERSCSDYHGGAGPLPIERIMLEAARLK